MLRKYTNCVLLLLFCAFCSGQEVNWKNVNFLREQIPAEAIQAAKDIPIKLDTIEVEGREIYYRETTPPASDLDLPLKTLFLLHGAAFTSANWENVTPEPSVSRKRINTMQTMAAAGYRVLAVDLPGWGKSRGGSSSRFSSSSNGPILGQIIKALSPDQPVVVVSPSMSGSFSLPLLLSDLGKEVLCGYIPVAPGSASHSSFRDRFSSVRIPTLIVVGQHDGKSSSQALANIPTSSQIQIIPNAGHPAYLDDPGRWHQLVYNFMRRLDC